MSKRKNIMDKTPRKLRANKIARHTEELTIPIVDIDSLIKIAQQSTPIKNINHKLLKAILPQLLELQKIIGMKELKNSIFYQIIYYLQNLHQKSDDYLHTVILGSPGCGKTTVAKIIGELYSNLGILKNHTFTIAKRSDLIGEYLGQTTIKTSKLLKSCIGGVLFIDEIYSLGPGSKDRKDSYSKEAIDALNLFLSEHKKDFCCIIAGYEKEVKECFFSVNQGLERRFQWVHKIQTYTPEELSDICFKKIKDIEWQTCVTSNEMINLIKSHDLIFKNAGGDIENLITKAKMVHARRVFSLDSYHKFILTIEDFKNAVDFIDQTNSIEKSSPIPLSMYS